jgi:3-phosphoshikimate 1-carboxyvinyltransferase
VTEPLWDAPTASGPVLADVRVPGSKSMTNRALVLAALASGRSTLRRPLVSRDTSLMVAALRSLGVTVRTGNDVSWKVTGGTFGADPVNLDVGNAGTVLRFVPPVAALASGAVSFDGDEAIRRRPIGALVDALRALGVQIDDGDRGGLPFVVRGSGVVRGGEVEIDASSSSQLVSALVLAGASYTHGVTVRHSGERAVPNPSHIAMSVEMVRARGGVVHASERQWSVSPGSISVADQLIEPDLSSAAPFLAAAVVTGGQVRIQDWPTSSTQPGATLPDILGRFGASSSIDEAGLVVRGGDRITGAEVDLRDGGELTPVIAAIAALADSPSRLLGVDYLRGHETDRLAALTREISALGGDIRELDDGLEIRPRPLHGNVFSTYDDHRLAMAAAVLGLAVPGLKVENIATTAKTLPGFADLWLDAVTGQGATR